MDRRTSAIASTGFSSGSSIWRKICQRLAPIARAALMGSGGRPAKPDSTMRNTSEVHCQTSAPTMAAFAIR